MLLGVDNQPASHLPVTAQDHPVKCNPVSLSQVNAHQGGFSTEEAPNERGAWLGLTSATPGLAQWPMNPQLNQ